MKRIIALLLSCSLLLSACGSSKDSPTNPALDANVTDNIEHKADDGVTEKNSEDGKNEDEIAESFTNLDDPNLLQFVEDSSYAGLTEALDSEDYIINDIQVTYISKEYLDEIAYNSKENIYFGFTLSEIERQFGNKDYVFTVDEDGKTIVTEYQGYDDTYEQVVKNVAIGSGVILICATVSVVTAGAGVPEAVSMVFAASAKTGAIFALSSGALSGVMAGVVTGIKEKDFGVAKKAALLAGSDGFKWGAITGIVIGGANEALTIKKANQAAKSATEIVNTVPTPRESELYVLQEYGGSEQLTYLAGEEVPFGTPHATRPDVIREVGGKLEAIEVKNYNLESAKSCNTLYSELERQVTQRVSDLPAGSTQRIVLDIRGRGFSAERVETVISNIRQVLSDVYPDIPIDVLR